MNRKYGWIRDLPNHHDNFEICEPVELPKVIDLREYTHCPPIYDQGQIGSCTANSLAGAVQWELIKQNEDFIPSRLFIYYNERKLEGTISSDSGAQIRDGVQTLASFGVCNEVLWPYTEEFTKEPDLVCYDEALKTKAISYKKLNTLQDIKTMIYNRYPVAFGFTVYSNFESEEVAKTGILCYPSNEDQCVGGHAVLAVGYDDNKQQLIVRNSWGDKWGLEGYFLMSYEYFKEYKPGHSLTNDFWVIKLIS